MLYLNDYDIAFARQRFGAGVTPNRLALAIVVDRLAEWTNDHSDGWAYWQAPRKAALKAMTLIQSTTNAANHEQERADISDEEMRAAVRPIRLFMARQGMPPEHREIILRAVDES